MKIPIVFIGTQRRLAQRSFCPANRERVLAGLWGRSRYFFGEAVRDMPERVQGLLGYDNYLGIGVVNVGSPRVLL